MRVDTKNEKRVVRLVTEGAARTRDDSDGRSIQRKFTSCQPLRDKRGSEAPGGLAVRQSAWKH